MNRPRSSTGRAEREGRAERAIRPLEATSKRFPRSLRVRSPLDFQRVYRRKLYAADATLVINAELNGLPQSRLGLSVSRAVGGAVVRNRWKRLIREAFRQSRPELPPGLDLVVKPRQGGRPELAAIAESLVRLADQLARRAVRSRR